MTFWERARGLGWGPRGDYIAVPALSLVLGLLLQRDGQVPLGDSWSFAWTAAQFVEHGRMAMTEAQAMTLVTQILLAAPAAFVFSPSPSTLNHFTLVLSAMTLSVFLAVYRMLGIGRSLSLVGVATVATNPIWLAQSMAFETEIPFLFFAALGTLSLLVWDRTPRTSAPWVAGLVFAAAAGVRQHALLFPIAGALYMLQTTKLRLRLWLPWVLPFFVVAGVYVWLQQFHGVPKAYGWQREMLRLRWSDPAFLLSSSFLTVVAVPHYLGWFLLPVSVVGAEIPPWRRAAYGLAIVAALLGSATGVLWYGSGTTMPYLRQVLDPAAVLVPLGLQDSSPMLDAAWTVVSLSSALLLSGAAFRSARVFKSEPLRVSTAAFLFLPSVALLFLAFNLLVGLGFDRYLLLPMPFLIPALLHGQSVSGRRLAAAVAVLTAIAATSVLLVDQRVRSATCQWDAAEKLRATGIEPSRINGGGSFNGYYAYDSIMNDPARPLSGPPVPWIQPRAEYLVVAKPLHRSGLTLVASGRCGNLPGFDEPETYTYQCAPSPPPAPPTLCQPF